MTIGHVVLRNEICSISDKIYLTMFATSKGTLTLGERFSIWNGEREDTGYVTTFPARILRMGLLSARMDGDVIVALLENNAEIQECSISLTNDRPRKHGNFDIPFELTEGCVINFVS